MKYMLMRKADVETENGELPSEQLLQAMADYNERLMQAGVFVTGDGLRPSREGCRIEFRGGEPKVVNGPFTQPSELLAGYSVLEVDSLEEAIAWAKQWPPEDADGNVTLELRRYFALEDFDPSEALEKHRSLDRLPSAVDVYLAFPGNCREAMRFYAEVFGGQLEAMLTFGETPTAAEMPPEMQDQIAHASLNLRGRRLMASDAPGDQYQPPQGAHIHLQYDDVTEAERVFKRLSEGGSVTMPFEQTFWAYRFGMPTDRFGVHWMVSCDLKACL